MIENGSPFPHKDLQIECDQVALYVRNNILSVVPPGAAQQPTWRAKPATRRTLRRTLSKGAKGANKQPSAARSGASEQRGQGDSQGLIKYWFYVYILLCAPKHKGKFDNRDKSSIDACLDYIVEWLGENPDAGKDACEAQQAVLEEVVHSILVKTCPSLHWLKGRCL